jgi:hypothetical protein
MLDALLDRGDATPTMLAQELPLTRQAVTKHLACSGGSDWSPAGGRGAKSAMPSTRTGWRRRSAP